MKNNLAWILAGALCVISCSAEDSVIVVEQESCETADDCSDGKDCIDGHCADLPDSCEHGESLCVDKTLYGCEEGIWRFMTICENACDSDKGACAPPAVDEDGNCAENLITCFGDDLKICRGGNWKLEKSCEYGCDPEAMRCRKKDDPVKPDPVDPVKPDSGVDPEPEPECADEGAEKCIGGAMAVCTSGKWVSGETCEFGCTDAADACRSCLEGDVICADGVQKTCTGNAWGGDKICEAGCAENGKDCAVPPECQNGAKLCSEGVLNICENGAYKKMQDCEFGCDAAAAGCAACKNGASRCTGGAMSACTAGQWIAGETCPEGCNDAGTACKVVNQLVPVRYLDSEVHSPITEYVAKRMKDIAAKSSSRNDQVFIKVGDSHYDAEFDGQFMICFASASNVSLDGRDYLNPVIAAFQSSFARDSQAAIGGSSTRDTFSSGRGYPLSSEINAMNPRFAFFDHGTNDMGNGSYCHSGSCPQIPSYPGAYYEGYAWAMQDYYRQMKKAMKQMTDGGIIPLITGVAPRQDHTDAVNYMKKAPAIKWESDQPPHMVTAFNAVSRGVAESMQVPFFNIYRANIGLPDQGLCSDKIHGSRSGSACNFTSSGLNNGVNQRNLGSIEMLNKAWRVQVKGEKAPDRVREPFKGTGTAADPIAVTGIPFTHSSNTANASNVISVYAGKCTGGEHEYGGEIYYRMELPAAKRLRLFAVSSHGVDADIHVLRAGKDAGSCIGRSDILLQGTFAAGTYHVVVDTYGDGANNAGEYLMGIVECDADDHNCDKNY